MMSTIMVEGAMAGRRGIRSLALHRTFAPIAIGVLGFLVSAIGIGSPSIWYDEVATISASTRTWPQLLQLVGSVDLVHAAYYSGMHVIFDLIGYTPLTLRLPSALAVGVAAALTVLLGRQLGTPRLAIIAGVLFSVLPRVTWMGSEGRSYALSATLAVALTLVLVLAVRRGGRWWILYSVLAAVACVVFVYVALIVVAHGVSMAMRHRSPSWTLAAAAAGAVIVPFGLAVAAQGGQLHWIKPLGPDTLAQVFRDQWFSTSVPAAVLGWALLVGGSVVLGLRGRRSPNAHILLPALIVPTVALLAISAVHLPIYTPRYLAMCTPFVALVMAAAVDRMRFRPAAAAMLAAVVLAVPQVVEQRHPDAKEVSSWAEVADAIAAERAADGQDVTTAIIYGTVEKHPIATARVIEYAYPDAFTGTVDVTLDTPAALTGQLWETTRPLSQSLGRLDGVDVVYLITSGTHDDTTRVLATDGWRLEASRTVGAVDVVRYER